MMINAIKKCCVLSLIYFTKSSIFARIRLTIIVIDFTIFTREAKFTYTRIVIETILYQNHNDKIIYNDHYRFRFCESVDACTASSIILTTQSARFWQGSGSQSLMSRGV